MKNARLNQESDTPRRRASDHQGSGPRRQRGYVERATAQGHSGRGSDSVLPHLRDQLRLKALLPSTHPVPEMLRGKEEHHQ